MFSTLQFALPLAYSPLKGQVIEQKYSLLFPKSCRFFIGPPRAEVRHAVLHCFQARALSSRLSVASRSFGFLMIFLYIFFVAS